MTDFRGIPEPRMTPESHQATLEALKESVERDAQGIRDRQVRTTDPDRARAQQLAGQARRVAQQQSTANDASLAELRELVATLESRVDDLDARVLALESEMDAVELQVADHETRITTLEGGP